MLCTSKGFRNSVERNKDDHEHGDILQTKELGVRWTRFVARLGMRLRVDALTMSDSLSGHHEILAEIKLSRILRSPIRYVQIFQGDS